MKESKVIFILNTLRNIIGIFFDTFFVLYFFQVANYEIVPLAKYNITVYLFLGVGFFLIRNAMKKNVRVPYFRLGIALEAIYIASIMILRERIIDYAILVGMIKGMAEGFYYFPYNLLFADKVPNKDRQKFNGIMNVVIKISAIIIPIILGVALSYYSYVEVGRVFFMLFIVMFILSFSLKDGEYRSERCDIKGYIETIKKDKTALLAILTPLLTGLAFSSGMLEFIVTLFKINNFETNLNVGYVDSICGIMSLVICALFAVKIKKKSFKSLMIGSGIISFIMILILAFYPSKIVFIIYLIVRFSFILLISLVNDVAAVNVGNLGKVNKKYKSEYYLVRDLCFCVSRGSGYIIVYIVASLFGMSAINYVLVISAFAVLLDALVVSKLSAKM